MERDLGHNSSSCINVVNNTVFDSRLVNGQAIILVGSLADDQLLFQSTMLKDPLAIDHDKSHSCLQCDIGDGT